MKIDSIKLNHWLNIRKTSLDVLNKMLKDFINFEIDFENLDELNDFAIEKVAEVLQIPKTKLLKTENVPSYIYNSKEQIEKTRRPITRDGIHFYNYYTLPAPKGYVAPVLIDILCPKEKLPALNNGHLEPAITVSLGPKDIYARFHKKITPLTFHKFKVNKDKKTDWIVGSSYYEPSYCVHTYSRAENGPGKILSYTTSANLENLLKEKLNDDSFKNFVSEIDEKLPYTRQLLKKDLENKGFDLKEISKKTKTNFSKLSKFFKDKKYRLSVNEIYKISYLIGSDPGLYIEKKFNEDKIGRNFLNVKDSIQSIRKFKSYKVATIAGSSRSTDLSGYFIKVKNLKDKIKFDLNDSNCSHYLVTKGNLTFHYKNSQGKKIDKLKLKTGDSIWVSSYSIHGFTGDGALIKISDGQNFNYLDKLELTNTYKLKETLIRGKNDKVNWGYDHNTVKAK